MISFFIKIKIIIDINRSQCLSTIWFWSLAETLVTIFFSFDLRVFVFVCFSTGSQSSWCFRSSVLSQELVTCQLKLVTLSAAHFFSSASMLCQKSVSLSAASRNLPWEWVHWETTEKNKILRSSLWSRKNTTGRGSSTVTHWSLRWMSILSKAITQPSSIFPLKIE